MSDNQDANQLIIESVPLGGMTRRLIDPYQATQIRAKVALALGVEDEELAAILAFFQRTGQTMPWTYKKTPEEVQEILDAMGCGEVSNPRIGVCGKIES